MEPVFRVETSQVADTALLRCAGELAIATLDTLRRAVSTATTDVTLDFSGVDFVDSKGMSLLISLKAQLEAKDRSLALTGIRPAVRRVFEVAGLTETFSLGRAEGINDEDRAI